MRYKLLSPQRFVYFSNYFLRAMICNYYDNGIVVKHFSFSASRAYCTKSNKSIEKMQKQNKYNLFRIILKKATVISILCLYT